MSAFACVANSFKKIKKPERFNLKIYGREIDAILTFHVTISLSGELTASVVKKKTGIISNSLVSYQFKMFYLLEQINQETRDFSLSMSASGY